MTIPETWLGPQVQLAGQTLRVSDICQGKAAVRWAQRSGPSAIVSTCTLFDDAIALLEPKAEFFVAPMGSSPCSQKATVR